MARELKVGDPVVFIDEGRSKHAAIVTRVWESVGGLPGCNLAFVVGNESQTDQYGRQIERRTSLVHVSQNAAHASAWQWPDE